MIALFECVALYWRGLAGKATVKSMADYAVRVYDVKRMA